MVLHSDLSCVICGLDLQRVGNGGTVDSGYTGPGYTGSLVLTDWPNISTFYIGILESLVITETDRFQRLFCGNPI